MNREIKFRAWDKENKTIIPVAIFLIEENKAYPHGRSYIHNCQDWESHDLISNPIMMQYTGMKDKRGVEIYEGDIVEFKANYTTKPNGFIIGFFAYNEETASFVIKSNQYEYVIGEDTECFNIYSQVIGNIYENPELLTNN